MGKFIPKNTICAIVMAVSPHFNTAATTVKFGLMVQTWDSPKAKFCIKKSIKGVYPFWANLYQTLQISAIFAAVSLHFKSENGEIWRECTDPGHPLPLIFVKKIAQGDLSLGGNFYQKFDIFANFSYLSPYFYTDNVKILPKT